MLDAECAEFQTGPSRSAGIPFFLPEKGKLKLCRGGQGRADPEKIRFDAEKFSFALWKKISSTVLKQENRVWQKSFYSFFVSVVSFFNGDVLRLTSAKADSKS